MNFARQANEQLFARSINYGAQQGASTQKQVKGDNGLRNGRRPILRVMRGSHIRSSPLSEYKPALVGMGRLPVVARSGNEDAQHLSPGEEHQWGLVGDMTPAEIGAETEGNTKSLVVGVLAALALGVLVFRRV